MSTFVYAGQVGSSQHVYVDILRENPTKNRQKLGQCQNLNMVPMPVFDNIRNHVVSPFIQMTDSITDDSE